MILVDSDGVLVDWENYVLSNHFPNMTLDALNSLEPTERHERIKAMYVRDPMLFAKLQPLPGAAALIKHVTRTGLPWFILTAIGNDHPDPDVAEKSKRMCLKNHFDIPSSKIITVQASAHKQRYATPERILVDDYDKNCQQFRARGGLAVQVTREGLQNGDVITSLNSALREMDGVVPLAL